MHFKAGQLDERGNCKTGITTQKGCVRLLTPGAEFSPNLNA